MVFGGISLAPLAVLKPVRRGVQTKKNPLVRAGFRACGEGQAALHP